MSNTTHEKLGIIKDANGTGSFDTAIRMMIQGCVNELDVIEREQIALTLTYEGYGNVDESSKKYEVFDFSELNVTFSQLRKAEIDTMYQPELGNHVYYSYDIAQVVYTEKDFLVIKITTYVDLPWVYEEKYVRLVGVNLL